MYVASVHTLCVLLGKGSIIELGHKHHPSRATDITYKAQLKRRFYGFVVIRLRQLVTLGRAEIGDESLSSRIANGQKPSEQLLLEIPSSHPPVYYVPIALVASEIRDLHSYIRRVSALNQAQIALFHSARDTY